MDSELRRRVAVKWEYETMKCQREVHPLRYMRVFLDGWMLGRWAEGAGCRNDEIMEQEVAVCSKLYAARALRRGANNGATREVRVTIYPCNVALQMQ